MSNAFARFAFNAAVATTNAVHMSKRGSVATAKFAGKTAVTGAVAAGVAAVATGAAAVRATKFVGSNAGDGAKAFWAGLKYANSVNSQVGETAAFITEADLVEVEEAETEAPKAKAKAPRAKRDTSQADDIEVKAPRAPRAKSKVASA